ncbi:hypothetical protein [Planomonospora algeriensis]
MGNCRHQVRGAAPTRRERLEDGLLDVRILTAARRLPRARAFLSVLTGRFRLSRHYQQWQADTLRISSPSGEVRLACDGEVFTVSGEVEFAKRPARSWCSGPSAERRAAVRTASGPGVRTASARRPRASGPDVRTDSGPGARAEKRVDASDSAA